MKNLSVTAKVVAALLALVGVIGFALIIEFGLSAGLVHNGVTVSGYDVGGLTFDETVESLNHRRSQLRSEEVCFFHPDFEDCVLPDNLGWFPRGNDVRSTAQSALDVGRDGGPFAAIGERVEAWTQGVTVGWASGPKYRLVTRVLNRWSEELAADGYALDKAQMRHKIKRGILMWPRRVQKFPVTDDS